jgi:uncharacterized protein YhaN
VSSVTMSFEQFVVAVALVVVSNLALQIFLRGLFYRNNNGARGGLTVLCREVDSLKEEMNEVVIKEDLDELKKAVDDRVQKVVCDVKMSKLEELIVKLERDIQEIKDRISGLERKIDTLIVRR